MVALEIFCCFPSIGLLKKRESLEAKDKIDKIGYRKHTLWLEVKEKLKSMK